ncbi:hypothetical protein N7540_005076 [Penicillium herquei]|nr:hypothetical protein N7540_005076 [Penicillium herquei]
MQSTSHIVTVRLALTEPKLLLSGFLKEAARQAGAASRAYKDGVEKARRTGRPSATDRRPTGRAVPLYASGHRVAAPLADVASSTALK